LLEGFLGGFFIPVLSGSLLDAFGLEGFGLAGFGVPVGLGGGFGLPGLITFFFCFSF